MAILQNEVFRTEGVAVTRASEDASKTGVLATTVPSDSDKKPWSTLASTTAIQALVSMAALTMPVLASLMGATIGIKPSLFAGAVAAVVYLGAILTTLLAGPLIHRWGAIGISQWGLVLCGGGLLLGSLGAMPAVFLGAFVIGLGYGPITPASSHLLVRSTPPRRLSLVFSIKQTGVPLGGLLAGALAPGLGVWAGWQAALVILAIPCIALAVLAQRLRRRMDSDVQSTMALQWRAVVDPIRMVLGNPALRRLALCSLLFAVVQLSVTAYSVSYLHDELGVELILAGLLLSVAQAGGVIGRIGWGYVADAWLGARATLIWLTVAMAISALAMASLVAETPLWVMLTVMLVFGAVAIGWNGVYLAEVARTAPSGLASTATGGTLAFTFLGSILGPVGLGLVIQGAGGMGVAYAFLALPLALAGAMLLRSRAVPS